MQWFSVAIVASAFFFISSLFLDSPDVGPFHTEAETALLTGSMVVGEDASASGGKFVLMAAGPDAGDLPMVSEALFCFDVPETSSYALVARVLAGSVESDSFYVRIGETASWLWQVPRVLGYTERAVTDQDGVPVVLELDSGSHLVGVLGAESGTKLDWLMLESVSGGFAAGACDPADLEREADVEISLPLSSMRPGPPANGETSTSNPPSTTAEAPSSTAPAATGEPAAPNPAAPDSSTSTLPSPTTSTTSDSAANGSAPDGPGNTPSRDTAPKSTPTTSIPKPNTTTTASKPTVATTTPRPPTTTTAPTPPTTDPPPKPSVGGGFGARAVGPGQEPRSTTGIVANPSNYRQRIEQARSGDTVLLEGGSYSGGFALPAGVTVKPYDGADVVVSGQIRMGSNSVLAGLSVRGTGQWAIHVDGGSTAKQNITIRNNDIEGGSVEAIRVSRNAHGVVITGNDISGGGNHNIKVHGEGSGHRPSATISNNRIHDPRREDGVQTQENGPVTIDGNTFWGTPENGIDVKEGEKVTITDNLFEGKSLSEGALLVHHHADAVVIHNKFASGAGAMLGSKNSGDPSWTFSENVVEGGGITLRRSTRPAIVHENVFVGGFLKLGISGGDHPRDARITSNYFEGTQLIDRVTSAGDSYVCAGNTLVEVEGNWSKCS